MRMRYETRAHSVCPVNPEVTDYYDVTVESDEHLMVEKINEAIADATFDPAMQETITERIAASLGATVTTVGYHSGVKTTCTA